MKRPHVILGTALLVSAVAGCGQPPAELSAAGPPNILLVTVDTLRWDRTGLSGGEQVTMPFLTEWANGAAVFERAYSPSSWTVPAVASLLTGLGPAAHGVVHGTVVDGRVTGQQALSTELDTLPERLRRAGYRTFAVTANAHLGADFGFAQGFDEYNGLGFRPAHAVNGDLETRLGEVLRAEPWFVWVHYFDPHAPYRGDPRRLAETGRGLTAEDRRRRDALQGLKTPAEFESAGIVGDPRVLSWTLELYDDELRRVDAAVRELFTMLDVSPRDLVLFTADHGEEFLDHGGLWHGHSLYEELVRVPLVVGFPAAEHAGRRFDEPVCLTDLLPTATAAAGLPQDPGLHGSDLRRRLSGEDPGRPIRLATEKTVPLEGLVDGDWKFLRNSANAVELYRLSVDPGETRNLAGERPSAAVHLQAELRRLTAVRRRAAAVAPVVAVDAEVLRELKSVGYLAGP